MTRNTRATILDTNGSAELMFPQFQPPVSLFLDLGLMQRPEIERKTRQLADSELVLVPIGTLACGMSPSAPAIRAAMTQFEPIFAGRYFELYRRKPALAR